MKKETIKNLIIHFLGVAILFILTTSVYLQFFWVPTEEILKDFRYPVILTPIFLWFSFTYLTYLFWNKKIIWKWIFILNIIFWLTYLIYTFPNVNFDFQIFFSAYFSINILFLCNSLNAWEEYKNEKN